MREILFRGKRIDNGNWIVGHLLRYEDGRARINPSHTDVFCYENNRSIIQTVAHEVDPETIGQFTGLTDNTKIFEGDIVCSISYNKTGIVKWYEEHSAFTIYCPKEREVYLLYDNDFSKLEVIGNVHDNPELLEG